MARLYADEDFPLPVVEELRRLGHDVRTVQDAGRAGQSVADAEVIAVQCLRIIMPIANAFTGKVSCTKALSPVRRTHATPRA
jgi:Domain of unknown function (DUF5615)